MSKIIDVEIDSIEQEVVKDKDRFIKFEILGKEDINNECLDSK